MLHVSCFEVVHHLLLVIDLPCAPKDEHHCFRNKYFLLFTMQVPFFKERFHDMMAVSKSTQFDGS